MSSKHLFDKLTRPEGRFSRITRRMWRDERFRRLSPIPPCGQGLWIYLLTHPSSESIPGVLDVIPATLAAELHWPLEAFTKAFGEVLREGLAEVDEQAGLIWLPKALYHNPPQNPNVIKSWKYPWLDIPECALKHRIYDATTIFLKEKYPKWLKTFQNTCVAPAEAGKALPKAYPKARGIQEQEQEQEQEILSDQIKSKDQIRSSKQQARAGAREGLLAQESKPPDQDPPKGLDRDHHPDEDFVDSTIPVPLTLYKPSPWLQAEAEASGIDRGELHVTLERYHERGRLEHASQRAHDRAFKGFLKKSREFDKPSVAPSPRSNGREKTPHFMLPPEHRGELHPNDIARLNAKPPWHPDFKKKKTEDT